MKDAVALLQTALVVGGPVYIAYLVVRAAERLLTRVVTIQEERAKRLPAQQVPIPADLEALALREGEPWAQDAMRTFIREQYDQTRDWVKVRHLVMASKT